MASTIDIRLLLYFISPWRSHDLETSQVERNTHILPADKAVEHIDQLVDHYLDMEDFTCCRLCVGLCVMIDGKNWTGYFGDHLWHLMGWFYGISTILTEGSRCETRTSVWDESSLILRREGNTLTMQDERYDGFEWSPITLNLWDVAAALPEAGKTYERLTNRLRTETISRGFTEAQLLERLKGEGDKPRPEKDDHELKLAIILRECDSFTPEPLRRAETMLYRHTQLKRLKASLSRLVEILRLDPDCEWRPHFERSLIETERLLEEGFTQETLNRLSGSVIGVYGGMGSFNDYWPGTYNRETGHVDPIPGTEDFNEASNRAGHDARELRVIGEETSR